MDIDVIIYDAGESFRIIPASTRAAEWARQQKLYDDDSIGADHWHTVLLALHEMGFRCERRVA